MRTVCPKCGGTEARQITPTFFECVSPVDASIPPGLFGNASLVGGARPCGHRYQAGAAGLSPPCGVDGCGRDSIGTCQGGCGRRLCGNHGSPTGSFTCLDCEQAAERRRQAERAQQEALRRAAAASASADAGAAVAACDDPAALRRLLIDHQAVLAPADCKAAWLRLVAGRHVSATHEIVQMVAGTGIAGGLFGRRGRGSWAESTSGRVDVWQAPRAGRLHREYSDGVAAHWEEGLDAWLDASGDLWLASRHPVQLSMDVVSTPRFVVPKGAPVELRRSSDNTGLLKFHSVTGAIGLSSRHAPDDVAYTRAVATVLSNAAFSARA